MNLVLEEFPKLKRSKLHKSLVHPLNSQDLDDTRHKVLLYLYYVQATKEQLIPYKYVEVSFDVLIVEVIEECITRRRVFEITVIFVIFCNCFIQFKRLNQVIFSSEVPTVYVVLNLH